MDLVLNNLQRLICHKNQPTKLHNKYMIKTKHPLNTNTHQKTISKVVISFIFTNNPYVELVITASYSKKKIIMHALYSN